MCLTFHLIRKAMVAVESKCSKTVRLVFQETRLLQLKYIQSHCSVTACFELRCNSIIIAHDELGQLT